MSDESTAPVLPPPTRLEERLLPWFWYATLIGTAGVLVWIVRDHHWHVVWRSLPFLLEGLGVSWALTLISVGIGMVVGTVLAAARMRGPAGVRHAAVFVIEVVRAIPQLMVIFWVFFTYPAITGGQSLSAWTAAVVSLSAIASAYLAEVIRAGISSVPIVQSESARVTGLTPLQGFVHVVLPQGLRNMLPALIAHFVMMFKITSLVYVIGIIDFFRAIILVNNRDFAPYALYTAMAVGYLVCCWALSWLVRRLDPKYTLTY